MTDREKLIELLDAIHRKPLGKEYRERLGTIADYLLDNGVNVHKWVPVAYGILPDKDGTYIVRTKSGTVTTARFYAEKTFPPTRYRKTEYKRSAQWSNNRNVTHWMRLPDPPKGRNSNGKG